MTPEPLRNERDELLEDIYDIEERIERLRDRHAELLRRLAERDQRNKPQAPVIHIIGA
ncbi:hypothetical protein [Paraburkholderia youngii]|uniref:hypothetical protein n=1 Tax=Paraburkholderia youngii TaxID=2782701 RepID=UPI00158FEBA6|nr:hypothetical protein [Paraburkholderia youngii]